MAGKSEGMCPMVDNFDIIPLITEDSSNEISDLCEHDVPITESNNSDVRVDVMPFVKGNVGIVKVGTAVDGVDQKELFTESGIKRIELGEALQDSQQFSNLQQRCLNTVEEAIRIAHLEARRSTHCAESCVNTIRFTEEAIEVAKRRADKARLRSDKIGDFSESTLYQIIGLEYDDAIKQATERILQLKEAAKSADIAAKKAEKTVLRMVEESGKASSDAEWRKADMDCATQAASMEVIKAYKLEYYAVMAARKCLQDLEPKDVVAAGSFEDIRYVENGAVKRLKYYFNTVSFILGIFILAVALSFLMYSDKQQTFVQLVTLGSVLITIPILFLLYGSIMWCRNRAREARRMENSSIIEQIDSHLRRRQLYFINNGITSVNPNADDGGRRVYV